MSPNIDWVIGGGMVLTALVLLWWMRHAIGGRIRTWLLTPRPWRVSDVGWREVDDRLLRTNIGWERRIADARLCDALAWAYDANPYARHIVDHAASYGTRVRWGKVPAGVNAEFSPWRNTITFGRHLRDEPAQVLACFLIHEVVHAAFRARECVGDYFQSEIEACFWEGTTYKLLRHEAFDSPHRDGLELLVRVLEAGDLADFVVTQRPYQINLLGRELVNP